MQLKSFFGYLCIGCCVVWITVSPGFAQEQSQESTGLLSEESATGSSIELERIPADSIEEITGTVRLLGEENFRPEGTTVTISLEDAIEYAMVHNPDVRIAISQVRGSLASYDLTESAYRNQFDIDASIQENLRRIGGNQVRLDPNQGLIRETIKRYENNEIYQLGPVYSRTFKNGIAVEVAPTIEYENDSDAAFDVGGEGDPGHNFEDRYRINTSVIVPLNSRPREEIRTDIDNAKLSTIQSDYGLTQQKSQIRQFVINQYWNIKRLEEQLDIQNERILQARRVEFIVQTQYEFENASQVQLGQAQIDVLNNEADMINLEGTFRNAQEQMNIILGYPVETQLELTDDLDVEPLPMPAEEYISLVTQTNLSLKNLRLNIRQTENNLRVARLGQQPNLSLSADYRRTDEGIENITGILAFNWPFGDGGATKARVRAINEQLEQQRISLWDLERNLLQETYGDLRELQLQRQRVQILRRNVDQAYVNLENDLFIFTETGRISFRDMQDSQIELAQARLNLTNAVVSYNQARSSLLQKVHDYQPSQQVEPMLGLLDPGYSRNTGLW